MDGMLWKACVGQGAEDRTRARLPGIAATLAILVASAVVDAGAQTCDSLTPHPDRTALVMDLADDSTWLVKRPVSDPTRVIVESVNPFAGRYRLVIGDAQELPHTDAVGLLFEFLKVVYPGLSAIPGLEVKEGQAMSFDQLDIESRAACPAAFSIEKDYNLLKVHNDSLLGVMRAIAATTSLYEHSTSDRWRALRSAGKRKEICNAAAAFDTATEAYLTAVRPLTAAAERHRLAVVNLEAAIRARADAVANDGACGVVASRVSEAALARANATAAEQAIGEQRSREARLDSLRSQVDALRLDPYAYFLAGAVPLQNSPADVDISVQRASPETSGDEGFRTIANRRIRFEPRDPFRVRVGVGAYASSIPVVEFEARRMVVANPAGGGDTTAVEVALAREQAARFVPGVIASVFPHGWSNFSVLLGVGVNATGEKTPNYLLGLSYGPGPFMLSLLGTMALVPALQDGQAVGTVLDAEADLRQRSRAAFGVGIGITLVR